MEQKISKIKFGSTCKLHRSWNTSTLWLKNNDLCDAISKFEDQNGHFKNLETGMTSSQVQGQSIWKRNNCFSKCPCPSCSNSTYTVWFHSILRGAVLKAFVFVQCNGNQSTETKQLVIKLMVFLFSKARLISCSVHEPTVQNLKAQIHFDTIISQHEPDSRPITGRSDFQTQFRSNVI